MSSSMSRAETRIRCQLGTSSKVLAVPLAWVATKAAPISLSLVTTTSALAGHNGAVQVETPWIGSSILAPPSHSCGVVRFNSLAYRSTSAGSRPVAMKTGMCLTNRAMASWTAWDIFSSGPMIVPSRSRAAARMEELLSITSLCADFSRVVLDDRDSGLTKKERPPECSEASWSMLS